MIYLEQAYAFYSQSFTNYLSLEDLPNQSAPQFLDP
jgi:hypothetical protein